MNNNSEEFFLTETILLVASKSIRILINDKIRKSKPICIAYFRKCVSSKRCFSGPLGDRPCNTRVRYHDPGRARRIFKHLPLWMDSRNALLSGHRTNFDHDSSRELRSPLFTPWKVSTNENHQYNKVHRFNWYHYIYMCAYTQMLAHARTHVHTHTYTFNFIFQNRYIFFVFQLILKNSFSFPWNK